MPAALRESSDEDLRRCLEQALAEVEAGSPRVTELRRRPFEYETSFAIDALDVRLADGSSLALLVKDVSSAGMSAQAAATKPADTLDPQREIAVYREFLGPAGLSTPRFYGAAVDAERGRWWLFLERVEGEVLTDVGEVGIWCEAAAWAARLSGAVAPGPGPLLRRDRRWHERWIDSAGGLLAEGTPPEREAAELLQAARSALVERLLALPQAFVHGEFYPANVLTERRGTGPARIAPVDWELAGTGPYALDLAALAGGWGGEDRAAMCRAFHQALPAGERPALEELSAAVDLCRLTLALQWIGWSPGWVPPEAQRHDWRGEATRLLKAVA